MKSLEVKPIVKVFPIAPPKGAREAYHVVGRYLHNDRYTAYDVIVWRAPYYWERKDRVITAMHLTCECKATSFNVPCYHILNVLKRRVPTATFWIDEADAMRQHRRYYPVPFCLNRVTAIGNLGSGNGGVLWVVEREAFMRVRQKILSNGSVVSASPKQT